MQSEFHPSGNKYLEAWKYFSDLKATIKNNDNETETKIKMQ